MYTYVILFLIDSFGILNRVLLILTTLFIDKGAYYE